MALIFSYGDYNFSPKPLFTIGKEYIKTPANMGLGTRYTLTLEGQIIPQTGKIPGGDPQAGLQEVFNGVDEIHRAFDSDFKLLHLYCDDGSDPIVSGYPRITEFSVNNTNDNYVVRADYSITLELPSLKGSGFDPVGPVSATTALACGVDDLDFSDSGIISYSDEFTVEFLDERVGGTLEMIGELDIPSIFSIQRNISAQGDSQMSASAAGVCDTYLQPWERAKAFITPRLGFPPEATGLSGLLCPASRVSNNFRSVSVNKTEGTVSVSETYIAMTGSGLAYEDFQINTSQSLEEPWVTVTVDGTINGLASIPPQCDAPDVMSAVPKFNNALSLWTGAGGISGHVFARAQNVYNATPVMWGHTNPSLNPRTLTETLGYNPIAGTVTYSYTFDNRPDGCYAGALTENITFNESEPNDVFASLTILGKTSGPLYQSIGTIGQRTRGLSIEAILPVVTDCAIGTGAAVPGFFNAPDVYDSIVINYESFLIASYTQVFVTTSSKTWDPRTGRFSLNQEWTVGSC